MDSSLGSHAGGGVCDLAHKFGQPIFFMFFQGHLHKCPAPAFRLAPDIHAILFPCWQEENSWEAQLDWMESSRPATPKVTTQQQRQKKVTAEMTSKSFKTNMFTECHKSMEHQCRFSLVNASGALGKPLRSTEFPRKR